MQQAKTCSTSLWKSIQELRLLTLVWGLAALIFCAAGVSGQDNPIRYLAADVLRDYPGRCFDSNRCAIKNVGQSWTVHNVCERSACQRATNGTLLERRTRCREISGIPSEDCYIIRVEGMPFPHCCPKLYCNDTRVTPDILQ